MLFYPSQLLRLIHINWVLVRHGLDEIILATHLFRPIRFMIYFLPWYWFRPELPPRGERIRHALEELGPIFVKFGQILSTRRDLLPDDIANELTLLQDRVPPFSGILATKIIEQALGREITDIFSSFEDTPFASASIAQVHGAVTKDNKQVVVKVLRPNIEKIIRRDIALLYTLANFAQTYWKDGRRLKPLEVVQEYEKTIFDELDLVKEAANGSQLRRNFIDSDILYIPEVYWDYTRSNILVMERISGIPVNHIETFVQYGIDLKILAERGVEIFFTQIFRDNFFHADMHPGNIFVTPEGKYIAVDFGIVGTLSPTDQRYLAENFLAFFNRDYRKVAELHLESEWVPSSTRIDEFESAIRAVSEPIFEKPLKEISFGHFLLRLFQTARRFDMEIQPQLVLLQKTLLNIEGLGRQLYPDLDLWTTAKPFLEHWMSQQIGPKAVFAQIKDNIPSWGEKLPEVPGLIHQILIKTYQGKLQVKLDSRDLQQLKQEIRKANQRNIFAIAGSALLVSATLLIGLNIWLLTPIWVWIVGMIGASLLISALISS